MSRKSYATYSLDGDIALIGLDRPEKRNAISDAVVEELGALVERARREAKAAVLFGHGDHFCAGLDLAEQVHKTAFESMEGSRRWHEIFARIEFGPIPWFSALHGAVVGGGLELASSTHIRVADETAFLALPEGQRGIFVGGGGSVRISRLVGIARMTDMMITGRAVSAAEAEAWNLVQYVASAGTALDKAVELARQAAANASLSNYSVINALPRIAEMGRDEGLMAESFISAFAASGPEAQQRLTDFLEKRAAKVEIPGTIHDSRATTIL